MASLHENSTWSLNKSGVGTKALGGQAYSSQVGLQLDLKIKRAASGNIERYKARLVAKGFMQQESVDYNEVFAPVSKHNTLKGSLKGCLHSKALLAKVAAEDMELHQLDIKTASLGDESQETIYQQASNLWLGQSGKLGGYPTNKHPECSAVSNNATLAEVLGQCWKRGKRMVQNKSQHCLLTFTWRCSN